MATSKYGVLFDVDGTLCDTNYLHTVAWSRALADVGKFAPAAILHQHIGMGSDKFTDVVLGEHDDHASEASGRHFEKMYDEVKAFPGAASLLRAIDAANVHVILASSANPEEFDVLRAAIDADDVIRDATNAGDADASKPDPDIFQAAMDKAGLKAENCIVVGDTVWDIKGAQAAHMDCIAVLSGGIAHDALQEAGAKSIYKDVADLLANLQTSPIQQLIDRAKVDEA